MQEYYSQVNNAAKCDELWIWRDEPGFASFRLK
jgi:hypothetical protein